MQQEHYIRRSQLSRNGTANAAAGTGDEVMFHLYRETILHFWRNSLYLLPTEIVGLKIFVLEVPLAFHCPGIVILT